VTRAERIDMLMRRAQQFAANVAITSDDSGWWALHRLEGASLRDAIHAALVTPAPAASPTPVNRVTGETLPEWRERMHPQPFDGDEAIPAASPTPRLPGSIDMRDGFGMCAGASPTLLDRLQGATLCGDCVPKVQTALRGASPTGDARPEGYGTCDECHQTVPLVVTPGDNWRRLPSHLVECMGSGTLEYTWAGDRPPAPPAATTTTKEPNDG
jgi:hypothetical protein